MKKNILKKSIMISIVFIMVIANTIPALACDTNPSEFDSCDPDIILVENHEEFNPEHFEGMEQPAVNHVEYNMEQFEEMRPQENHEEFNEENFEEMRPEEHREDYSDDQFDKMRSDDFNQQPYTRPMMPSYIWIIIAVGALVILMIAILIMVVIKRNNTSKH